MSINLTRRIVLAGTFTFAIGCGHDSTLLPTDARFGTDSLSSSMSKKYGDARWPYKLVINPAPVPAMAPGGTVKLAAKVTDPSGMVLNASVVWSSSNSAVATVGTDGSVTAKAGGTAVVHSKSVAVLAVTDSAVIVVQGATPPAATPPAATVKSITVGLGSSSVVVGSTTQATATLKDSVGHVVTGQSVTWMSLSPTVATVNATTGVVTAVAAGTSTITATSSNVTGSAAVTVTAPTAPAPPPPAGSEILATLPNVFINTTMPAAPAAGGKIISVAAGGSLQSAINSALPGDVIELANGATYSGNFSLPNKAASSNWIVIRPASMSGVPAEGSRMTPSKAAAARLPKVMSINNQGAFNTAVGAHNYRIVGIEVSVPATIANTGLVRLGSSYETTLAQMPHDIVLDRMYIHGTATGSVRRCIALNSAMSAVIDSYISDCHEVGGDAQAIAGWTGPGPFKIVNNYLEGSGENVMFGGDDPIINGVLPSDIEIRRNHIFKPTSWKGKWLVKNLFE
ncbi:MAG: Ig-like domain-containing protein, partial [bacterium]